MSVRTVDISDQSPVAAPQLGAAPTLAWVALDELVIDDAYQRPLLVTNWKAIRRIAAEFDWSMFTPVVVAPCGPGRYALIDGQHRAHAAALAGIGEVPAMIADVPPERQAASFAAINSRRVGVSLFHLFKAGLAAREAWAVASARAVDAAGCKLMTYNKSTPYKRPGEVFAVALVRDHVASGRDWAVTRGLQAIAGSDRRDQVGLYSDRVLRPLFSALAEVPGFATLDLEAFVSATDLVRVRDRVAAMRDDPEFAKWSDIKLAVRSFSALIRQAAREGRVDPARKGAA